MAIPNVGRDASMQEALATKMQLVLEQPMSDITTKLVNNDFEGDFFKIGDTVSICKPDPESVTVKLGTLDGGTSDGSHPKDERLDVTDLKFSKRTLKIDKFAKYAFIISDITKAEGKWNYESGNLDLTAQEIRKAHNLEVCELIANDTDVRAQQNVEGYDAILGTPDAPIQLANADELYEKILITMHTALYDRGAITADGQVTYGSNPQEGKQTSGAIFLPRALYNQFLVSKYFTTRSTDKADMKVETGNIAKVLGLDVNVEPALDPRSKVHAVVKKSGDQPVDSTVLTIIAGTKNAVTRAGKVLPPDSFRSQKRFGTEYHGLEIYGQEIGTKEAVVVAFVKLPV